MGSIDQSTALQQYQKEREVYKGMGTLRADVGGAGFQQSGTALDLLRDSASQGAISMAVLGQQGLITEAGYKEQAASYQLMSETATYAAGEERSMATATDTVAAQQEDVANQQDTLANKYDELASQQEEAGDQAKSNSEIQAATDTTTGILSGIVSIFTGIGSIFSGDFSEGYSEDSSSLAQSSMGGGAGGGVFGN